MAATEWFVVITLAVIIVADVWLKFDPERETISQATWRALDTSRPLMRLVLIAVGVVLGHLFW